MTDVFEYKGLVFLNSLTDSLSLMLVSLSHENGVALLRNFFFQEYKFL